MDWIDPRYADADDLPKGSTGKSKEKSRARTKPFSSQVAAALAQPLQVWSAAFSHALMRLKWPEGCTLESTWLWSAVIEEQAEVLVRAGILASKLASIMADSPTTGASPESISRDNLANVVGLMDQSIDTIAQHWFGSSDTSTAVS